MNIYERYLLPRLIDLAMRRQGNRAERANFVPLASGTVLEVGIGSGLNVPFYDSGVTRLYGVDPSLELWRLRRWRRLDHVRRPVAFVAASAERLPVGDATVDTVVTTWTLCTIPDPNRALREMRRVLKPEGRLVFVEHGRAPAARVQAWQDRLNPLWKRVAGGCNMNRRIDELIAGAGFHITKLDAAFGAGPKILAYLYKGVARPNPDNPER